LKSFNCNEKTQQQNLTYKDACYSVSTEGVAHPLLTDILQYVSSIKRMWIKWKKCIFYQSMWFCYLINTHVFKKRLQPFT